MKLFIALGTVDFLVKLKQKYQKENMACFYNNETAILIHESAKKTVFSAPRRYDAVETIGDVHSSDVAALTYIPIFEDDRPSFEFRMKDIKNDVILAPGSIGIRVLRPIKSDTYLIMTLWKNEGAYTNWRQTNSFTEFQQKIGNPDGVKNLLSGPLYTKIFYALRDSSE
ncbi:antibiotic biosynthesis monooxygenase family protein [Ferdinandcohnia quinoae]|uniref:Antibiotic biosynthesis monooxygenase n=1 Tax=Fredinandcohnia quinoae TaxID=2918902 RepID=A0AAW5E381_9BACI|nr:antibiotic biosynthesis monooxygenase family protein [Fredinandcohnia sp. SECRCQ15]MCH1626833.1 antibiotic biosynthesis monooxygenase [Fredinandcohnia sp. SECRCQ15]